MSLTIDDVRKTLATESGARSVSLSITPGADPQEVLAAAHAVNEMNRQFMAFPEAARVKAANARLRENLRKITHLAQGSATEPEDKLRAKLRGIFALSDGVPEAVIAQDLAWIKANGHAPDL